MSQREDSSLKLKPYVKLARFKGLLDISYFTIQLRNLNMLLRGSKYTSGNRKITFFMARNWCEFIVFLSQMSLNWYLFIKITWLHKMHVKLRKANFILICLSADCQRHVDKGLHVCHLQKTTKRRWEKALCLGRLHLVTISCLIGQAAGEQGHCTLQKGSPIRWQKVSTNGLQWNVALGNGLLSAGGLWKEPGGIKVTVSITLGLFGF